MFKNKTYLILFLLISACSSQESEIQQNPFIEGSTTTTTLATFDVKSFTTCSVWLKSLEKEEENLVTSFHNANYEKEVGYLAGRSIRELNDGTFIYDYQNFISKNLNFEYGFEIIDLYNPNDNFGYKVKTYSWNDFNSQSALNWANLYLDKLEYFTNYLDKYESGPANSKDYFNLYKKIKKKELLLMQHSVFAATPIYISNLDKLITHPIVESQPKSVGRILNISEELKDMRFELNNLSCS